MGRTVGRVLAVLVWAACLAACSGMPRHAGEYRHGAVSADHEIASRAGGEILRKGGNAVDAAVATSFTLSVVRPYSCGIGGGGFMVVHLQDHAQLGTMQTALNYRETAPSSITPDFYERSGDPLASRYGGHAVGVPGTVAGLLTALEAYGTMERKDVLAPAIRAAERGFVADAHYARTARELIARFEANPDWKGRFAFVWERYLLKGRVGEGDRIRVPEQARALRLIAENGREAFYEGEIADAIVRAIEGAGGSMTRADLAGYAVREVEPLRFRFYGVELIGMPPPSSGGVAMAQAMGLLERWGVRSLYPPPERPGEQGGPLSGIHAGLADSPLLFDNPDLVAGRSYVLAEAFKHAFSDRSLALGDPDHAHVEWAPLLEPAYLDALATRISNRTQAPEYYGRSGLEGGVPPAPIADDAGTSHFNVVDRWGNAVACTETINTEFGSLVGVPEFGFCLNNQMDDFTTVRGQANAYGLRQSDLNLPAPGKRPLSSMSPTIALDENGKVYALAGGSGGPRIITGTTQVLLPMLLRRDRGGQPVDVVRWPRLHHQWIPNTLRLDEASDASLRRWSDETVAAMRGFGHEIASISNVANVQAIRREKNGKWQAACDPNKGGRPAGH